MRNELLAKLYYEFLVPSRGTAVELSPLSLAKLVAALTPIAEATGTVSGDPKAVVKVVAPALAECDKLLRERFANPFQAEIRKRIRAIDAQIATNPSLGSELGVIRETAQLSIASRLSFEELVMIVDRTSSASGSGQVGDGERSERGERGDSAPSSRPLSASSSVVGLSRGSDARVSDLMQRRGQHTRSLPGNEDDDEGANACRFGVVFFNSFSSAHRPCPEDVLVIPARVMLGSGNYSEARGMW